MAQPANNVIRLSERRLIVQMIRFIDADPRLQLALLEWLQLAETNHLGVLSNPTICGRRALIFKRDTGRLVNEEFLRSRMERAEQRIELGRALLEAVGPVDRPRSVQFTSATDSAVHGQLVLLPVGVEGVALNIMRVAQW